MKRQVGICSTNEKGAGGVNVLKDCHCTNCIRDILCWNERLHDAEAGYDVACCAGAHEDGVAVYFSVRGAYVDRAC